MWAAIASFIEWVLNFWFEKKPALEKQEAQNAQNNDNSLSDDAVAKRVRDELTR